MVVKKVLCINVEKMCAKFRCVQFYTESIRFLVFKMKLPHPFHSVTATESMQIVNKSMAYDAHYTCCWSKLFTLRANSNNFLK